MDLKRVQEELKNDLLRHQALMQQLKKTPLDQALKLKLRAVQQHIAELGSQQKKIALSSRGQNIKSVNDEASSSQQTPQKLESKSHNASPAYTLITIKNGPNATTANNSTGNYPMNLSRIPSSSTQGNKLPAPALLVVTSPNQIAVNRPAIKANVAQNATALPVSLSNLVSTGGIVTLAGGWKGPLTSVGLSTNSSVVGAIGRLMPGKPVQIKVPVVQSPGSNQVILMPQKPSASIQQKSFLKLLPKGRHPIPISTGRGIAVNRGAPIPVVVSSQTNVVKTSVQKQFSTILMQNDVPVNNAQPVHQVLVQRVGNNPSHSSVATPTSVTTWQDLSSRTPAIHKPSYVPRKSYPNINNGVGSFQKFKILDGKAQILPKQNQQESPNNIPSSTQVSGNQDKPRNTALKAVLTSSKPVTTTSNMVTLARLFPSAVPQNGFFPIQSQQQKTPIEQISAPKSMQNNSSPFIPVPVTTVSSTPTIRPPSVISDKDSKSDTPGLDETAKTKLSFLRNIDLIPKEQAEKVRGRRFRKRRVAANPIYSGGMYISNELEPKRHCPDVMAGALESITAPDVIVKRPRGRPRGSKNVLSPAARYRSSTRGVRSTSASPVLPTHVEELRQLRGILDVVASASKAVTSAGVSTPETKIQDLPSRVKKEPELVKSEATRLTPTENSNESDKKDKDESGDEHEDQCATCGKTGEVLMCDTCSRVYHLSCATPPLIAVPQGMWICFKCKTEFKDSKPTSEWPGIVAVVHSYMEHDKQRDKDIENEQEKLRIARKCVSGLQLQTKNMTSTVMNKVNLRGKAMKEKQSLSKEICDISSVLHSVWSLRNVDGKNQ